MTQCLKTGAYINLVEWNQYVPMDMFQIEDTYVFRYTAESIHQSRQRDVDFEVYIGTRGIRWDGAGVIVVPTHNVKTPE